MQQKLNELSHI